MSVLDGPGEGTWSVFALKVVQEREELRFKLDEAVRERDVLLEDNERLLSDLHDALDRVVAQDDRREREHEALLETAQKALAHARRVVRERDEALAQVSRREREHEAHCEALTARCEAAEAEAAKMREKE